jgi:hypothetical protein
VLLQFFWVGAHLGESSVSDHLLHTLIILLQNLTWINWYLQNKYSTKYVHCFFPNSIINAGVCQKSLCSVHKIEEICTRWTCWLKHIFLYNMYFKNSLYVCQQLYILFYCRVMCIFVLNTYTYVVEYNNYLFTKSNLYKDTHKSLMIGLIIFIMCIISQTKK